MSDLAQKKCVPCAGGVPPLTKAQAENYLRETPGWEIREGDKKIGREFKFKNFKMAMTFVGKVAKLAEAEGHHPDFHVFYNRVVLESWTHAIGGLAENDFILAAKINNLPPE